MRGVSPGAGTSPRTRMSRGVRVARGAAGALITTLLAAASHAAAGGVTTLFAVTATTLFALPLCVALAGRTGSLWRLSVGVGVSQFVYHWSFAGLGVASASPTASAIAESPHAAHLAQMQRFVPELAAAGAADALMWVSHALSAILTIAVLHRGERAIIALGTMLRDAVIPFIAMLPAPRAERPTMTGVACPVARRDLLRRHRVCAYRGPPSLVAHVAS